MDWLNQYSKEAIVGGVVVAGMVVLWLRKSGLITFGNKTNEVTPASPFVEVTACSERLDKCLEQRRHLDDILHSLEKAIVLQTHIVSTHEENFKNIDKKFERTNECINEVKREVAAVKALLNARGK